MEAIFKMKKLLMLGSSTACRELVLLARSKGIYTIVTDNLDPQRSKAKLVADEYWMISTADVDLLEEKCRAEGIEAVLCGISDFNTEKMAELCKRLNLPCYCTPEVLVTTANKYNFKKACHANGVPVATDYYLSNPPREEELDSIKFPVVVKAVDLAGNEGMSYCYNKEDVVTACAYARSLSDDDHVITERMLHGVEYEAHYVLAEGEASLCCFAAMLPQPGLPANCYGVTTTATNNLQTFLTEVDPYLKKLLKNIGCHEGVAWFEMIFDEDGHFYILEMGYRMSGDAIEIPLKDASGFDTIQWLLENSLGTPHSAADLPPALTRLPDCHVFSYILWSKNSGKVTHDEGIEEIAAIPGVRVVLTKRTGDSYDQYQYMFMINFVADDHEKMIELVKKVNETVKMEDENGENVLLYYDDFDTMRRMYQEGMKEQ